MDGLLPSDNLSALFWICVVRLNYTTQTSAEEHTHHKKNILYMDGILPADHFSGLYIGFMSLFWIGFIYVPEI